MSQYGANKVATAVLLDTSPGMDVSTSNGASYFERSKWILSRIILRKIFAYETDEVGLLTFGLSGVKKVCDLKIPNWEMFRAAENVALDKDTGVIENSRKAGNWARGLISAVDFLEEECQGKRFKSRQLVILSNFTWSSPEISSRLETLVTVINGKMLNVIVIGVDIKKESQDVSDTPAGLEELLEFVSRLDNGMTLSFEEVEEDMKFYQKKKKAKRLTKGVMKIGSQINVPFKWMKVTNEDTRLKFAPSFSYTNCSRMAMGREANGFTPMPQQEPEEEVEGPWKKLKADFGSFHDLRATADFGAPLPADRKFTAEDASRIELKFAQDESRKTRFGASEVLLTYADLEAMKRKTGLPSLTFLGSVKSSRISRSMLVGDDVYVMVSDGTKRSQAQLTAIINSLLRQNKYGLARRIASKDGKVAVGILYPVSDDLGKALYFLKLPLADWVTTVPSRPLPDDTDQSLVDMINGLVDAMSIKGRGRDLLLKDPNFQTRAALVESRARSALETVEFPQHIIDLFDPYPEQQEAGKPIVDKIMDVYSIPPPPPKEDPTKIKVKPEETVVKKELTEAERKEVADIEDLVNQDPDSLAIDGMMMYKDRVSQEKMDTEDIFKLMQSPL